MLTILNINGNLNYGLVEYQNYPKTWLNFEIKSVNNRVRMTGEGIGQNMHFVRFIYRQSSDRYY